MATATFYPDKNPESTSVDGYVRRNGTTNWADVHDATTGSGGLNTRDESILNTLVLEAGTGTDDYQISRSFLLFDTSSIPDDATITSAVVSIWWTGKSDGDNDAQAYTAIYSSSPASNTALVDEDYDQVGSTVLSTTIDITTTTADGTAYTDYTLNATGRSAISKTGITKFSIREGHDAENTALAQNTSNYLQGRSRDTAGAGEEPKLVVTYIASSISSSVSPSTSISSSVSPSTSISSSVSPSSSLSPSTSISSSVSPSTSISSSVSPSSSLSPSTSISSSVSPSTSISSSVSPSSSISSSASSSPSSSVSPSTSISSSTSSSISSSVSPSSSISSSTSSSISSSVSPSTSISSSPSSSASASISPSTSPSSSPSAPATINFQINIGDTFKDAESMKININDEWKVVDALFLNIGDTWKTVF